jgi:hypothetical protein
MSGTERYVVLGLAPPRSAWFRDVSQWAHAGLVPVEFIKCVSAEELRARLSSTRPHSAVLVDACLPGLDRELLETARGRDCAVLVVGSGGGPADEGVLPASFSPAELTAALAGQARLIGRADALPGLLKVEPPAAWRGSTVMVCGPGGTGTSTVAIALAQGLADSGQATLLADLALRAEQAMLHGAPDVGPGVQELAESHRAGSLSPAEVVALTWHVEDRRYHLVLGLRRRRSWPSIRPRAFELAFDSLRRAFDVVVVDADDDLEGEAEGGSVDVEERHVMARTAARHADAVFVVGQSGMKGIHAVLAAVAELADFGVPVDRLMPVINQAPRLPRARAEIARALAELGGGDGSRGSDGLVGPLFLPRRAVDQALRDGARLPAALSDPLAAAYQSVIDRVGRRLSVVTQPVAIVPGTIGSWSA